VELDDMDVLRQCCSRIGSCHNWKQQAFKLHFGEKLPNERNQSSIFIDYQKEQMSVDKNHHSACKPSHLQQQQHRSTNHLSTAVWVSFAVDIDGKTVALGIPEESKRHVCTVQHEGERLTVRKPVPMCARDTVTRVATP
jgi:hypothetical protein